MAFTVNEKTLNFTSKALDMYRGGLLRLAEACFQGASCCKLERFGSNCFSNDVFIWALLLQTDLHGDEFFSVGLKHGWFAWKGLPPWRGGIVYGNYRYPLNFEPAKKNSSLVTPFHIGKHIFHYFGYHHKGALSVQAAQQSKGIYYNDSWRRIKYAGDLKKSLWKFIGNFPSPQ